MRNKIVNLLHVCSVMTPRSFKLFDEPQSSIANTMVKMKREGVVEKSNNTEVFEDALNIARAAHSRDFSHELAADRSILN